MRKPVVDYKNFRLRRINRPEYRHLWLLLGWVAYFAMYFLTENLIPAERCRPVHMALDDRIPFCEGFLIPYVCWYALVAFSLLYFLLYDIESFKGLQTFFIVCQAVAVIIYILLPTRQDLRPEVFPRDNFLTRCVGLLYRFDTNTGVCPSMHVAFSLGLASVWLKSKDASRLWKCTVVVAVITICLSTMFIKQHSAVDVFAALPVCLLAEAIAWGGYYRRRFFTRL